MFIDITYKIQDEQERKNFVQEKKDEEHCIRVKEHDLDILADIIHVIYEYSSEKVIAYLQDKKYCSMSLNGNNYSLLFRDNNGHYIVCYDGEGTEWMSLLWENLSLPDFFQEVWFAKKQETKFLININDGWMK
jgi:hypothetical protein